jgi:molybdate transport system permease protein
MNSEDIDSIRLSLEVALTATMIVFLTGTPLAWVVAKRIFPGKALVVPIAMLPLVLPPTVTGFVLLELLGRRSLIGHWLENHLGLILVFHWSGAVLASTVTSFPLYFLAARSAFEGVDSNLENAARLLGAPEKSVFFRITLPLALRQLSAGLVLAFVRAVGDFGATLMLAGNIPGRTRTAALALYDATVLGRTSEARSLVAVLGAFSVIALWLSNRANQKTVR